MLSRRRCPSLVVKNYCVSVDHAGLLCLYDDFLVSISGFILSRYDILRDEAFSRDRHQALAAIFVDYSPAHFCSGLVRQFVVDG